MNGILLVRIAGLSMGTTVGAVAGVVSFLVAPVAFRSLELDLELLILLLRLLRSRLSVVLVVVPLDSGLLIVIPRLVVGRVVLRAIAVFSSRYVTRSSLVSVVLPGCSVSVGFHVSVADWPPGFIGMSIVEVELESLEVFYHFVESVLANLLIWGGCSDDWLGSLKDDWGSLINGLRLSGSFLLIVRIFSIVELRLLVNFLAKLSDGVLVDVLVVDTPFVISNCDFLCIVLNVEASDPVREVLRDATDPDIHNHFRADISGVVGFLNSGADSSIELPG